jgi:ribose-phosphate pyrophosphokinase
MKIIGGPSSITLSSRLASILGSEVVGVEIKSFPDNETYIRLESSVEGEEVLIVQSTPTDRDWINLFLLLDACRDAKNLRVIIPYFGYSRQDKKFREGEAISSRALAGCINASEVILVNIHSRETLSYFQCRVKNVDASPLLAKYIKERIESPVALAPDEGASYLAKNISDEWGVLKKRRIDSYRVELSAPEIDLKKRNVVIIDDIISTGGTLLEAAKYAKKEGAKKIYAACIHPVLVQDSLKNIYSSGIEKIMATDTIENETSIVSVAPLLAEEV